MVRWHSRTASFAKSDSRGTSRHLFLVAVLVLVSISVRAADDTGFTPLFTGTSLKHSIGEADKGYWSVQDNGIATQMASPRTQSVFLLRQERFGNFILKFQARSDGAVLNILFRAAILPPGQLAGFAAPIGGPQWGSLNFRKPTDQLPKPANGEPGHAAPGFPDAPDMPFLRASKSVELAHVDSSKTPMNLPQGQWVDCEIDALGNHVLIKVNGATTANFVVDSSFYEKFLGIHPPAEMTQNHDPFYEGMIGFELPPESLGKVELKDIRVKILGDVHWPEESSAAGVTTSSKEGWTASPPNFQRTLDSDWSQQSRELLEMARNDKGFQTIFDGKSLQGWSDSASFWAAQGGSIVGRPRNVFLITDRKYSDFILRGSVRLSPPGGNSGIQLRSAVVPDGMQGYQFDMGNPWWGQLYVESTLRGILAPVEDRMKRVNIVHADGWNDFVMICSGSHLIGELNGQVTYDFIDYYGEKSGLIGLQIHEGAPMTVEFKGIEIKELH